MPAIITVITGATFGIGKVTATELARMGHAIYMLVRNTAVQAKMLRRGNIYGKLAKSR